MLYFKPAAEPNTAAASRSISLNVSPIFITFSGFCQEAKTRKQRRHLALQVSTNMNDNALTHKIAVDDIVFVQVGKRLGNLVRDGLHI